MRLALQIIDAHRRKITQHRFERTLVCDLDLALPPPDRVAPCQNFVDQRRNGSVMTGISVRFRHTRMCKSRIRQDAEDFAFWQNIPVIQRQKQGLHDRERGGARNIHGQGHREKPFK